MWVLEIWIRLQTNAARALTWWANLHRSWILPRLFEHGYLKYTIIPGIPSWSWEYRWINIFYSTNFQWHRTMWFLKSSEVLFWGWQGRLWALRRWEIWDTSSTNELKRSLGPTFIYATNNQTVSLEAGMIMMETVALLSSLHSKGNKRVNNTDKRCKAWW